MKSYRPVFLLLSSIVLSAAAQLLMKAGLLDIKLLNISFGSDFVPALEIVLQNKMVLQWLLGGFICYGLSMLAWLLALTRYQISYAYPMLGLSYILVYLGAIYWDKISEVLSYERSLGILLILVGVALVNIKTRPAT